MNKIISVIMMTCISILLLATQLPGNDGIIRKAKEYGVNDYSITYYDNGTVTHENPGKASDENTVFELGSNGKMVAAYIALKLADEGKIGLDDEVLPFLDSDLLTSDERMSHITLRELLSHTAGFSPSYELGIDKKIYSDPGERFRYSGVGYIYLQSVIENVSGMTMDEAAKHYVFDPLGMTQSTFSYSKTVTPYMRLSSVVIYSMAIFLISGIVLFLILLIIGRITGFKFFSTRTALFISCLLAGVINTLFLLLMFVSKVFVFFLIFFAVLGLIMLLSHKKKKLFYALSLGYIALVIILGLALPVTVPVTNDLVPKEANCAYTLRSTGSDMALFAKELMNEYNTDHPDKVSEMFIPAVAIDEHNNWGLGIAAESHEGHTRYWHSGINPGFQSLVVLYPDREKFIIVLTNSDNGLSFSQDIAREYLDVEDSWEIPRT